jgi:hypothetical protein
MTKENKYTEIANVSNWLIADCLDLAVLLGGEGK